MPATEEQIAEAIRKLTASRAYRDAEEALGFAALCVVGTHGRVPRTFGDNQGAHPSRLVVTTGNPAHAAQIYNRGVHSVGGIYHTQVHVWLVSKAHAERAKAWIEQQLGAEALLNGWASAEPWHYEILFGSAAEALGFEMFDDREKMRRVLERARRAGR